MQVNLLFGFLGSGKTTLAKKLLARREPDVKTAVIVNEFGEVGIDGDILRGENVDVVELNSGCLCCTLRGSLMLAVEELRDKAKVGRVIVEATGVAQPGELLETLADSSLRRDIDIGPLVTVVDAAKFPKLVSMLGEFYVDQIENADIVLVNKIDLVSPEQRLSVAEYVRELNPEAKVLFAEQGDVEPGKLFAKWGAGVVGNMGHVREGRGEGGSLAGHDHDQDHAHDHGHGDGHDPHEGSPAHTFVLDAAGSLERSAVVRFFEELPESVWRAKGFVRIDGIASLVQYTFGQLEVTPAGKPGREAVVFIGQDMDRADIAGRFARMSPG